MQTLFTSRQGAGEPLLVLHGWGMNHCAWSPVKNALQAKYQVAWVDLPGHGGSVDYPLQGMDQAVQSLIPLIGTKTVHVMGWSLGGLIAQRLAHCIPEQVASLTLVASTASFIQRENWLHAMPEKLLSDFYQALESDYAATIKRFLLLQFMGVKGGQSMAKQLYKDIMQQPPALQALQQGLKILLESDFIEQSVACPVHWILGEKDKLVPAAVMSDLQRMPGDNKVSIIEQAGHAPFITHADEFVSVFTRAMQEFAVTIQSG